MIIDLSHTITKGLITYKGLPAPVICDYLSREESRNRYAEGTEFQIAKIEMVGNTGTYIDCPFHRYEHGKDFSELDAALFVDIPGIIISAPFNETIEIGTDFFSSKDIRDKAVIINTGWSKFWGTDAYFENHPFVTANAAEYLRDNNVKLVGIDSHNIDDTRTNSRPVHSMLLAENILIVEHLSNLDAVPKTGFAFTALPPRVKGVGTFPVRAIANF